MFRRLLKLFEPAPKSFAFHRYETDDNSGEVRFRYSYDSGIEFCDLIQFHYPLPPRSSPFRAQFEAALDALNVVCGVLYYQGFTPRKLIFDDFDPTPSQRNFFQDLYVNGLAEFGYRKRVDVIRRIDFSDAQYRSTRAISDGVGSFPRDQKGLPGQQSVSPISEEALPRVSAVLIGGGKDSIVSVEVLRAANEPMVLFSLNPTKPIHDCVRASGFPFIEVHQVSDPQLKLLKSKGGKRGAVPRTAIKSLAAIAAAFVYGFDTVILSNERSAEEGNLVHEGREINHQYVKTGKFERRLQAYLSAHISSNVTYFSLLRPLSELHIARLLAKSARYDDHFMSCNDGQARKLGVWCRRCGKCRFAFLILATAMPFERVHRIFGANLLDEEEQLQGYEELVGLSGHKPWECVGEIAESAVAILSLAAQPTWKDALIVKRLAPRLQPLMENARDVWEQFLTPSPVHYMPKRFEKILHAYAKKPEGQALDTCGPHGP